MNTILGLVNLDEYETYRLKHMSLYQKHAYAYIKKEQEEKRNESLRNK